MGGRRDPASHTSRRSLTLLLLVFGMARDQATAARRLVAASSTLYLVALAVAWFLMSGKPSL